jgi:hypothetical protein
MSTRPIDDHPYHDKSDAELYFIAKDAHAAAKAMQGWDVAAELKYLDQVNDACTVMYWRRQNAVVR